MTMQDSAPAEGAVSWRVPCWLLRSANIFPSTPSSKNASNRVCISELKVRKAGSLTEAEQRARSGLLVPDANAKPLGMEVPEHLSKKAEPEIEEDDDIFVEAGDDYDPLAGMDASEDESEGEDEDFKVLLIYKPRRMFLLLPH